MTVRAIDCWVNVNMSGLGRPEYLKEVAKNYFKQGEDFFRDYTIEEILKTIPQYGKNAITLERYLGYHREIQGLMKKA